MTEVSRYITIIRPELMTFCQDACRAATLNHLLFRIAYKCKDQPKEKIQAGEVLWYAKTELITSEMSDAWGVCKVRKEVNALLAMNLIGKRSNPTWGADRTKHFFFGSEQCQVFINLCEKNNICIVHLGLPAEVVHLIYSSNANDKSIKCSCSEQEKQGANDKSIACKSYNHQMETIDLSDANDKSIEAITEDSIQKITNKDNYEEKGTYGEFADRELPTPTQSLSQDIPYEPDWVKPTHEEHQNLQERVSEMQSVVAGHDAALKEDSYSHFQRQDSDAMVYSAGAPVAVAIGKTEQATQAAPAKKQGARKSPKAEPAAFTEQGQQVYTSWGSLFKSPPPAGEQTIKCANALYPLLVPWCHDLHRTCAQLLGDIQKWMYATDKTGWYKRGITLCDVHRDFEKWQSAMTHEAGNSKPKPENDPYSIAGLFARQNGAKA